MTNELQTTNDESGANTMPKTNHNGRVNGKRSDVACDAECGRYFYWSRITAADGSPAYFEECECRGTGDPAPERPARARAKVASSGSAWVRNFAEPSRVRGVSWRMLVNADGSPVARFGLDRVRVIAEARAAGRAARSYARSFRSAGWREAQTHGRKYENCANEWRAQMRVILSAIRSADAEPIAVPSSAVAFPAPMPERPEAFDCHECGKRSTWRNGCEFRCRTCEERASTCEDCGGTVDDAGFSGAPRCYSCDDARSDASAYA